MHVDFHIVRVFLTKVSGSQAPMLDYVTVASMEKMLNLNLL